MKHFGFAIMLCALVLCSCHSQTNEELTTIPLDGETDAPIQTHDYSLTFAPYTPPIPELPFTLADVTGMQGVVTRRASQQGQILGREAIYYTVHTDENGVAGKYHVFVDCVTNEIFLALSGNAELLDTDGDGNCEVMMYTTGEKQLNGQTYMTSAYVLDTGENGYIRADLHAAISDYLRKHHAPEAEFHLYCHSAQNFRYLLITGAEEDYREYDVLAEYTPGGYRITDTRMERFWLHPQFTSNSPNWWVETESTSYTSETGVVNPLYKITVCGADGERYSFDDRTFVFSTSGEVNLTRSLTVHPNLPYAALCVPDRLSSADEIPRASVYIIDLTTGEITCTVSGGEILWNWCARGTLSADPTDYCDVFLKPTIYTKTEITPDENGFSVRYVLMDTEQREISEEICFWTLDQ